MAKREETFEEREARIILTAKREAHGACPKWNGHFPWTVFFSGFGSATVIAVLFFFWFSSAEQARFEAMNQENAQLWRAQGNIFKIPHGQGYCLVKDDASLYCERLRPAQQ